MADVVCNKCGVSKPDIAYPTKYGQRNGRICLACFGARRRRSVDRRSTTYRTLLAQARWHCPKCGRGHPDAYPHTGLGWASCPPTELCRACHAVLPRS